MLPVNAQNALNGWIAAAMPVVEKINGQSDQSWSAARADYVDGLDRLFPATEGVAFTRVDLGGVATMVVTPDNLIDGRVLFYIHGGGYVHGGVKAYQGLAGNYARLLGARVYVPDYRQAPEHPFPTPIEDTFTAYRSLLDSGIDPRALAISGDSAGGAMVITIMRKARDFHLPLPAAAVAISPWADLTHSGDSARVRDGIDPLCSTEFLNQLAATFLAGELPTHPDASPVFADVRGLAPVLIQIGENEVMLSGAMQLASHLAENRVRTSLEVWPGMFHVWHLFAGLLPEADQALRNAVRFLDDALPSESKG
ncbi:acetyl esterase/lipase [Erwinia toletana]|uniref:Acetyl esterase/lipase n=1 Tax=Winslowiella toletana TaxID=92490 RepID=A0ABS4PF00_9GAMM|nr:alpha/beta hydrolase [Winslowiella toletana]MBP2171228.1 acetyl esterase/lipase [Winslowiella toletana]